MKNKILIIDGHPDATGAHFVHELADFYRQGAKEGGHAVRPFRLRCVTACRQSHRA